MARIIELFSPGVLDDEAVVRRIGSELDGGRAVVIQNALRAELAEKVHRELDACTAWKPYEGASPFFHYRHHNLYAEKEFPPSVLELKREFDDPSTKEFIGRLSKRDCSGVLDFGASWYLPGDHSLPHQDSGLDRSVAFLWHLTKNWDSCWGGGFFWCPSGTTVLPQFNCLTLFNVSAGSSHFVTVVSQCAREKRLALNGWWTGKTASPAHDEPPADRTLDAAGYGARPEPIDRSARIIAI